MMTMAVMLESRMVFHTRCRPGCAVVIGDNGHHAVVQAEDRHEDEALELEIGAEHGGGGGGEDEEDLVHAEGHHRADGLHDDGGDAHPVDLLGHDGVPADVLPVRCECPWLHLRFTIRRQRSPPRSVQQRWPQRRRPRSIRGSAAQAEDQNGVHDDVDDGAQRAGCTWPDWYGRWIAAAAQSRTG